MDFPTEFTTPQEQELYFRLREDVVRGFVKRSATGEWDFTKFNYLVSRFTTDDVLDVDSAVIEGLIEKRGSIMPVEIGDAFKLKAEGAKSINDYLDAALQAEMPRPRAFRSPYRPIKNYRG